MLNLYDYLTPLDSKRIENYVTEWGIEDGYVGNDTYLSYWKENKKKLFHLLGGNLIIKRPFSYEKPQFQLEKDMHHIIRDSQKFFSTVYGLLRENKEQYSCDRLNIDSNPYKDSKVTVSRDTKNNTMTCTFTTKDNAFFGMNLTYKKYSGQATNDEMNIIADNYQKYVTLQKVTK